VHGGVHVDMPSWFSGDVDSLGECGVGTERRFRAPLGGPGGPANRIFWYAYSLGSVTIVMLSSEHSTEPGSPQADWLARTLAAVNRSETPWLIVTQHREMYHAARDELAVQLGYIANLEPLFMQFGVDLVMMGHIHNTMRSCAIYNWTCVEDGRRAPVYVVSGSSGALLEAYGLDPDWKHLVEFYDEVRTGFHVISALNHTTLRIRWISNADGSVADESYIVRGA
jgi:hypothetical protein